MKTLILGLGSIIRRDDGVGNRIAQVLQKKVRDSEVSIIETDSVGFGLLDNLVGCDKVIVVDAMKSPEGKPGQIHRLGLPDIANPNHVRDTHLIGIDGIIELGNHLGMAMPKEVVIYGIEVEDILTFGEGLTPKVEKAVPEAVKLVLRELDEPG